MSETTWTDISLETAGCVILIVIAYKLYRMRLTTESDCCGGAVHVQANNPGGEQPAALQSVLGADDPDQPLSLETLEKLVQSKLVRTSNDFTADLRAIRELKRARESAPEASDLPHRLSRSEQDCPV